MITPDANIHAATLGTTDSDFQKFSILKVINPQ